MQTWSIRDGDERAASSWLEELHLRTFPDVCSHLPVFRTFYVRLAGPFFRVLFITGFSLGVVVGVDGAIEGIFGECLVEGSLVQCMPVVEGLLVWYSVDDL